jgi:hypothetical protein
MQKIENKGDGWPREAGIRLAPNNDPNFVTEFKGHWQ